MTRYKMALRKPNNVSVCVHKRDYVKCLAGFPRTFRLLLMIVWLNGIGLQRSVLHSKPATYLVGWAQVAKFHSRL
jgi:hypothetical protein